MWISATQIRASARHFGLSYARAGQGSFGHTSVWDLGLAMRTYLFKVRARGIR